MRREHGDGYGPLVIEKHRTTNTNLQHRMKIFGNGLRNRVNRGAGYNDERVPGAAALPR